jgi:hypothetical protein
MFKVNFAFNKAFEEIFQCQACVLLENLRKIVFFTIEATSLIQNFCILAFSGHESVGNFLTVHIIITIFVNSVENHEDFISSDG